MQKILTKNDIETEYKHKEINIFVFKNRWIVEKIE